MKRFHMGWLQVKRWLSFLPAAFVVYILLHYLVYQPDLPGPQPDVPVPGGRVMNGSLVSVGLDPRSSAEGQVIPMLVQDKDPEVTTKNLVTQAAVPQEPAAPASGSHSNDDHPASPEDSNTTRQHQGSATPVDNTDSRSLTRFDSARKALGSVSFREPLSALPQKKDVRFISDEVVYTGSGGVSENSLKGFGHSGTKQSFPDSSISSGNTQSNSYDVLPGLSDIQMTSSGDNRAIDNTRSEVLQNNVNLMSPLGSWPSSTSLSLSASSPPSSSSSSSSPLSLPGGENANLLKDSHQSSLSVIYPNALSSNIHNTSAVDNPESLAYELHDLPAYPVPSHPSDPLKLNPSMTDYDPSDVHQGLKDAALLYDHQNVGYPYQMYADGYDPSSYYSPYQHYKLPDEMMMEEALQRSRALFHQQQQQQQQSGIEVPAGNLNLPPIHPRLPQLPPRFNTYAYSSGGQGRRVVEEHKLLPQGPAVAPSHNAVKVSSTVRTVSSSASLSSGAANDVASKTQARTADGVAHPPQASVVVAAPKSKPSVITGTGTVTKKTTVVKKSNVASSHGGLSINALSGRTKVGEKYESGFSVPHEELCINNGRDLKVLILITTAPDHEKHRTAVRQTWGHFAIRKDVVMAFVVGRTTNVNVQNNLDKENEVYGDIIQANFIDHYANLTLKTVSMFEWVKTYCSESHFVLKTDDDMFINMPLLLTFVDAKKNDKRVMYGRLAKGWKPVRNKKSKYYIDVATYKKSKYPDFLTGPAYLFTSDIVDDIYHKALDTIFFVLEDVLVTGIVGESLRIRRVGDSRFRNEKIKLTDTCALLKTLSIHMVKYEEQFDIYKRTLDGKAKCKTG